MEQFRPGRIAEEALDAKAAHQLDRLHVVIEDDGLDAAGPDQPVDDLPEPPDPGNDDRALVVDLVGLLHRAALLKSAWTSEIVGDEKQRRDQHGQRHHQQQLLRKRRRDHVLLAGEGHQDEAEFAGLSEPQA